MSSALIPVPLYILSLGAVLVYLWSRAVTRRNAVLALLTAGVLTASLIVAFYLNSQVTSHGPLTWQPAGSRVPVLLAEPAGLLLVALALFLGVLVSFYSARYLALDQRYEYYYPLLLLLCAGVSGMMLAVDLFVTYLFSVLASATAYVLVAFRRRTETAIEAGFKYVAMSSMASIIVLAGVAFVFRSTGSLALPVDAAITERWGRLGIAMLLFGYLVKAAVFPAHTWLPDAHGRAPSSVSALLSGIVVEAYLYVAIKLGLATGISALHMGALLIIYAVLMMTVGNLMALRQVYGKRLLGYSSIAQIGYMMAALGVGFMHGSVQAVSAGFMLLVAHAIAKALAFLAKGVFHFSCGATLIRELDGMIHRVPIVGFCFVVALASLAGVPPLAGFTAKLQAVMSMVQVQSVVGGIIVAVFLANGLLSLGYYLPLIGRVLAPSQTPSVRISVSAWMQAPIVCLAILVLLLGLFPGPLHAQTQRAARFLLTWGPLR